MKKIVALVLSLVMVLGLATTAFAAPDQYDFYKADKDMNAMLALGIASDEDLVFTEFDAKSNADKSGNVAYIVVKENATNGGAFVTFAVKTTSPTTDSYAVTAAGKTDVLFYIDFVAGTNANVFQYSAPVTEFTNFGLKCGQYYAIPEADDVYFQTAAGAIYLADDATTDVTKNYLLDGEVVSYDAVLGAKAAIDHDFSATNFKYDAAKKVNVPTEATCTVCLMQTTSIYLDGKVPATYKEYALTNGGDYVVGMSAAELAGTAPSAPVVDGDKVESAETFDAGIAMYVGMSVMAAAGSAVVLKKKD